MKQYWLKHWISNEWVPYWCYSCIKWEPEKGNTHRIHCDKWILMNPNEYCNNFSIDDTKTPEEVINFIKNFI